MLHRFELARDPVPAALDPRLRPVLYNSWEATEFRVDEAGQMALAEKAANLGIERFVMDDGWFGQRNNDHAGLGDWYVNPQKFPNGLKPLIDKVHALGMDFGLWVEPEMVNPDSDLYRKHPDWVMQLSRPPAHRGAQPARPQPRPHRRARLRLRFPRQARRPRTTSPSSSGITTATGQRAGWPDSRRRPSRRDLRAVHAQPLLDPRPSCAPSILAGNRILLRRRRPRRPRHSAPHRRGLALRQHRSPSIASRIQEDSATPTRRRLMMAWVTDFAALARQAHLHPALSEC